MRDLAPAHGVFIFMDIEDNVGVLVLWYPESIADIGEACLTKGRPKMKSHLPMNTFHTWSAWERLDFMATSVDPFVNHAKNVRMSLKFIFRMLHAFELHRNVPDWRFMGHVQLARNCHIDGCIADIVREALEEK